MNTSINKNGCTAFYFMMGFISGKSLTSLPENTTIPYSGVKCKHTWQELRVITIIQVAQTRHTSGYGDI